MPVVIILFLIFIVLLAHIAHLKLRNWRLEKKLRNDPTSNDDSDPH
ncbi:MAG: hypothetical protein R6W66_01825 [Pelovirga sp.]